MNEATRLHLHQAAIALRKAHLHLVTARAAGAVPADEIGDMASTANDYSDRIKVIVVESRPD